MIWSLILAWTEERIVNVHHNSCIKVQEIFLFLSRRMGVQLHLYIKVRLPYRDVKNWMWLPWEIQRKSFLPPAVVVRILIHLDSVPKCTCTAVSCLWQKTTFGNQLAFLVCWVAGRRMTVEGKASPEHLYSSGISHQKVRKVKSWQVECSC